MEDDFCTPYRISCLRQQRCTVDNKCQNWPIRGYTVTSFLKLVSQAFFSLSPQPTLVFFLLRPIFFFARHKLTPYTWNRLQNMRRLVMSDNVNTYMNAREQNLLDVTTRKKTLITKHKFIPMEGLSLMSVETEKKTESFLCRFTSNASFMHVGY